MQAYHAGHAAYGARDPPQYHHDKHHRAYVTTGNNFTKAANKSVKEASSAAVRHGMALHRGQGRKNHRHAQADDGIMLRGFKCKL